MKALNIVCFCALAASIIALPFLLINWTRYMNSRPLARPGSGRSGFPTRSVSFFLVSALTAIVLATVMTTYARHDALNFIQGLSGNYKVYINRQQVQEPDKIISALKEIRPYSGHHSHPTKRIRIDILSDARDLTLELGRDSDRPQEDWVFYSQEGVTSNNEIGRITTSAFDDKDD